MIFFYIYMYLERECLVCLKQASVNLPISKVNFFRFLRSYLAVCVGAFVPDLVLNSDICQTVSSDIYMSHMEHLLIGCVRHMTDGGGSVIFYSYLRPFHMLQYQIKWSITLSNIWPFCLKRSKHVHLYTNKFYVNIL